MGPRAPSPDGVQTLADWEEVRGSITRIEETPMGLRITLRPEAPEVSFPLRIGGKDPAHPADLLVGVRIEALRTPAGVRVRGLDRPGKA